MSKAIAMIFAAGLGTRFKPWTDSHPKALAPVHGKPLLQRNIEYLQKFGIYEAVVNVHHFADQVKEAVEKNKGWGSRIFISDETDEILETGGGFIKARPFLEGYNEIVTINADILTDLDLGIMLSSHRQSSSLITLAVMKRAGSRYLLFSEDMKLGGWRNISSGQEIISVPDIQLEEFAFSGITVCNNRIFEQIKQSGKFSLLDVFLELCKSGTVSGHDHTGGLFIDVGKPGSREQAEQYFS